MVRLFPAFSYTFKTGIDMANQVTFDGSCTEQAANAGRHSVGRFFHVTAEWAGQASNAYDLINALKRIFASLGNGFLQSRMDSYLDIAAVPRLPTIAIPLARDLYEARSEKLTAKSAVDWSHRLFDVGSTACYALAAFKKRAQSILKAASVLDVLSDSTDCGVYALKCRELAGKWSQLKTASAPVQRAVQNEWSESFIQLMRTITAVAVSVLACWVAITGVVLVPAVALIAALANSFFTIFAHYHKNYWCNGF